MPTPQQDFLECEYSKDGVYWHRVCLQALEVQPRLVTLNHPPNSTVTVGQALVPVLAIVIFYTLIMKRSK